MNPMSAIVLFGSIWAIVFLMILPLGITSQSEAGEIVPGTPASAPTDAMVARKALITTGITSVLFGIAFAVVHFHLIALDDIPFVDFPSGRTIPKG